MPVSVPLKDIAVFVPDGAIIPLRLNQAWRLGQAITREETVFRIFPPPTGVLRFHDEAVSVECSREAGKITLRVSGVIGTAGLWVKGDAASVQAGSVTLPRLADRGRFEQTKTGFTVISGAVLIRHVFTGNDEIVLARQRW